MKAPRLSVVIPVHDRIELLRETLASLRSQTRAPDEVIVVDDGSEEGSLAIIEEDPRNAAFTFLHQKKRGVASARNLGVAAARGEWIAFLDSDDLWAKEKIACQLEAIAARPGIAMHYCDHGAITRDGVPCRGHEKRRRGGMILGPLFESIFVHTSGVVIRRDLLGELGGFREELRNCEDYDLWLRVSAHHEIAYLDRTLYSRRVHEGSLSKSPDPLGHSLKCQVLEEIAQSVLDAKALSPRRIARRLARCHFVAARAHARCGHTEELGYHRARALELRPFAWRVRRLRD